MKIYLYDIQNKKATELNLVPEYSASVNDLYVVFFSKGVVCSLMNGKESEPFNEYYIKKITHIVGSNTIYDNCKCCLTIGYYASNDNLIPFLIDQNNSNGNKMFDNSSLNNDENGFREILLFNYNEYILLMELGIEKLTINEYLIRLINNRLDKSCFQLYKTPNLDENKLVASKEFEQFLDQEEKR